jgi:hypothetical protein
VDIVQRTDDPFPVAVFGCRPWGNPGDGYVAAVPDGRNVRPGIVESDLLVYNGAAAKADQDQTSGGNKCLTGQGSEIHKQRPRSID